MRARAVLVVLSLSVAAGFSLPAEARTPRYVSGVLPVPHRAHGNNDAEPGVAAAPDGTLWATSNSVDGPCGTAVETPATTVRVTYCGANVWRSLDGGRRWQWIANPFVALGGTPAQQVLGGGDADIAVATEKNDAGHYTIYVASLWMKSNAFAFSEDGGTTWTLLPAESTPGVWVQGVGTFADRPWVGADGACTAFFAFNHAPGNLTVMATYDVCGDVPVRTDVSLPFGDQISKVSGRFVVDRSAGSEFRSSIYYPALNCEGSPCVKSLIVTVRRGGSGPWVRRVVAPYTDGGPTIVWPMTLAVDAVGRVYAAWHDGSDGFVAFSDDGAETWSDPIQLNRRGTTAVYPTLGAGRAGRVSVAWYGADVEGPSNDIDTMGEASARGSVPWRVVVRDSYDGGRTWTPPVKASPVVHTGIVCLTGLSCTEPNSRNLLDDFGVEVHPRTGRTAVVYTSDQPGGQDADIHTNFLAEVG